MSEIAKHLEEFTAANSQFETSRDYISISHCSDPIEKILVTHFNGFEDSLDIRLRCYNGYKTERDLIDRIKKVYTHRIKTGIEISEFGGLVKGHPDFTFDGFPADCKSLPLDEYLPFYNGNGKKIPNKVYWQMQGYMFYMHQPKALVIYESRETGRIMDYWIRENTSIQNSIDMKFRAVIDEIQRRQLKTA